jgi:hypothetical protein
MTRRVERHLARDGREGYKLQLYIRISESDLYDWDITARAILHEIAYMRVQVAPTIEEEPKNLKALRATPSRSPFTDYENWCWASQETLAERVGTTRFTVSKKIKKMLKDKVLFKRQWTETISEGGYTVEHFEYKVNEDEVDAHQRTGERKPKGRKPGTKAFASVQHGRSTDAAKTPSEVTTSHLTKRQRVTSRGDNESLGEMTAGHMDEVTTSHRSTSLLDFSPMSENDLLSTPTAKVTAKDPSLRSEKQNPKSKPNGRAGSLAETKAKPNPDYCIRCGHVDGHEPGCPVRKKILDLMPEPVGGFEIEEAE